MIQIKDGYKLESTNREIYVNQFIIGINPSKEVFEGYDGILSVLEDCEPVEFSQLEKHEIAEYMIRLWSDFGNVSLNYLKD
ncbi:MAG: hypothetical protein ABIP51_22640 [Bacteroidia bacterium]